LETVSEKKREGENFKMAVYNVRLGSRISSSLSSSTSSSSSSSSSSRSAVGGVGLGLGDDGFKGKVAGVVGLDIKNAEKLGLHLVFAGRVEHPLLDLGTLATVGDEDQSVATNAFTRREPDVVNSIATFPLCIPAEDIIGELFVLFDGGVRLVVSWILKLLVNYDILQVVAYSEDDAEVRLSGFHALKHIDALVVDFYA